MFKVGDWVVRMKSDDHHEYIGQIAGFATDPEFLSSYVWINDEALRETVILRPVIDSYEPHRRWNDPTVAKLRLALPEEIVAAKLTGKVPTK